MSTSRLLMSILLLCPLASAAGEGGVDLRAPAPALFTGPGALGDGEYTGPRTRPRNVPSSDGRLGARARGCPRAVDGSDRPVTGSVTTGIGHSRAGTSRWNAADLHLCSEHVNAAGDVSARHVQLRVGHAEGPGGFGLDPYGIPYRGSGGPFDAGRAGWYGGAGLWPDVHPAPRESWSEGRRPWR
ncbi:hypothetical protein [Luteimonas deserti]|uniref:Uncharacterized protein n=1 Tax=Luteimonas deserti TaxID=2752306 RepID=A0A7Z0QP30_9GAMM|nr:hypothetical protein [Luteimonas deserti]NYZ62157.1 hypothetical protein [Luteimonas deserti]